MASNSLLMDSIRIPKLLAACGLVSVTVLLWRLSKIGQRPRSYPPGPPTLPLIGNIHQMPNHLGHLQFQKWAEEYGPIYSLVLGTKVMIVISSDQAVKDLLDKRSAIYSSRPEFYVPQEILSGGLRVLFMSYNETWRMIRKTAHRILNVRVARSYVPYQDLENKAMLMGLLEQPNEFISHIRRYTTSLTTQMAFGYRTPAANDPQLLEMFELFEHFSDLSLSTGAALLDVFPLLRLLPDAFLPVRRLGQKLHQQELALFRRHYENARKQLMQGTAKPCCCVDLLQLQKEQGISDDLACYMSGSLLQAGSETTAAILVGFFQAMLLYPEVVTKAQQEIDHVCGDRMPDLNDVPNLPYIHGCVKESLRWMPTAPMGVPHAVTQNDSYNGYLIPKDATVIMNVWAIQNDPNRHPEPRRFDPSRWKGRIENSADSAANPDVSQRDHFTFGAGRRICQGMHIADRSLFLAVSRTLWAFNIRRPTDASTGHEIVPDMDDIADGMFICPNPFKASIVPRDDSKAAKVRQEWDSMLNLLDDNGQWKEVPEGLIWKDYEPMGDSVNGDRFDLEATQQLD